MKRFLFFASVLVLMTSCDVLTDRLKSVLSILSRDAKSEETATPYVESDPNRVFSCGYDGFVNMRGWPSYKSRVIAQFRNGPEGAALIEHRGEWTKIDMGGTVGWVPTKYVWHTPTVAYTGNVDIDWVAGAWSDNHGYGYVLYSNGYWEYGYDYPVQQGYYIMQNNEVKIVTVTAFNHESCIWEWTGAIGSSNDSGGILEIDESTGKLGGLKKLPFVYVTYDEPEDAEWPFMTKSVFKSRGKECAAQVAQYLQVEQYLQDEPYQK